MPKQKFNYKLSRGSLTPYVPIRLFNSRFTANAIALVDTGSDSNILPYKLGIDLGFVWDDRKAIIPLLGNVNAVAAPLSMTCIIGTLDPVELAFAWASNNIPPLILGRVNFFTEYNVCFYQSRGYFEVSTK